MVGTSNESVPEWWPLTVHQVVDTFHMKNQKIDDSANQGRDNLKTHRSYASVIISAICSHSLGEPTDETDASIIESPLHLGRLKLWWSSTGNHSEIISQHVSGRTIENSNIRLSWDSWCCSAVIIVVYISKYVIMIPPYHITAIHHHCSCSSRHLWRL